MCDECDATQRRKDIEKVNQGLIAKKQRKMQAKERLARQTYGDQFVDEVLMMTENRDPLQVRNYLLDEGDHSLVEILEFIYEIDG